MYFEAMKHFGTIGGLLLIAGTFLPIISVPLAGNLNFFGNGNGQGSWLIWLGLAGIVLSGLRLHNYLVAPAVLAAALLVLRYKTLSNLIAEPTDSQLQAVLQGSTQMQFGWVVLFAGAVMMFIGAFYRERPEPQAVTQ